MSMVFPVSQRKELRPRDELACPGLCPTGRRGLWRTEWWAWSLHSPWSPPVTVFIHTPWWTCLAASLSPAFGPGAGASCTQLRSPGTHLLSINPPGAVTRSGGLSVRGHQFPELLSQNQVLLCIPGSPESGRGRAPWGSDSDVRPCPVLGASQWHTGICHFPQPLDAVPLMGSSEFHATVQNTGVGSNLLDMLPALFPSWTLRMLLTLEF